MPRNTERQVKDFIIEYALESMLKDAGCAIKFDRTTKDFIEYAKWTPFKYTEGAKPRIDVRGMLVDYFTSDCEHYFELKRKIEKRKEEISRIEAEIS